jgi:Protein of unknown function (DUF3313)
MHISVLALVALLGFSSINNAQAQQANAPLTDDEGLAPVSIKGLDHVYARPGANLSEYRKVMLDPVEVSFSKSWKPDRAGGPITAAERQTIREGLAKIFREELTKVLQRDGGYPVVTTADEDVLRIRAEIRDLYINAPDFPRTGSTRVYALSAGAMRLVAELRDAPTGALIARVVDLKRDPDAAWLHLTTRIDNANAARRAIADWAAILRKQLDAAHAVK